MNVNSSGQSTRRKAYAFTPLNLATVLLIVAWLAFACYALTYLISH